MDSTSTKSAKPRKTTGKKTQTSEQSPTITSAAPTQGQIATRTFEIYLRTGCPSGQDEQNWLQAEKELREEGKK